MTVEFSHMMPAYITVWIMRGMIDDIMTLVLFVSRPDVTFGKQQPVDQRITKLDPIRNAPPNTGSRQ